MESQHHWNHSITIFMQHIKYDNNEEVSNLQVSNNVDWGFLLEPKLYTSLSDPHTTDCRQRVGEIVWKSKRNKKENHSENICSTLQSTVNFAAANSTVAGEKKLSAAYRPSRKTK
jgi:hypothetical protein